MASFDLDDPVREALSEAYSASGLGPTVTIDEVTGVTSLGTKKNPTVKDWRDSYKNYINGGGSAISAPDKMSTSKFYSHSLFEGSGASYYSSPRVSQGLMADIQTTIGSGSPTTATATDAGAGTTSAASYAPRAYRRYMQESSGDVYGGGPSTGAPEGPGSTISADSVKGVTLGTHDRPTSVLADIPFTMKDTQTIGKQGTFREGDFLNVPTAAEIMANPDLYGEMTREEAEQIDRRTVNEFAEDYMSIVLGNKTGEMTIGQQIKALQDQDFSPQDIAKKMASMGFAGLAKSLVGVKSPTPFDPFIGEIFSEILFGTGKSQHGRIGTVDKTTLDHRTGNSLEGLGYNGDALDAIAGFDINGFAVNAQGDLLTIDGMYSRRGLFAGPFDALYSSPLSTRHNKEASALRNPRLSDALNSKNPAEAVEGYINNLDFSDLFSLYSAMDNPAYTHKDQSIIDVLSRSKIGKPGYIRDLLTSAMTRPDPVNRPMGALSPFGADDADMDRISADQRALSPFGADYSQTDYTSSDVSAPGEIDFSSGVETDSPYSDPAKGGGGTGPTGSDSAPSGQDGRDASDPRGELGGGYGGPGLSGGSSGGSSGDSNDGGGYGAGAQM